MPPFRSTWTPKVCEIMIFRTVIMGLGLLFYLRLGFGAIFSPTFGGLGTSERNTYLNIASRPATTKETQVPPVIGYI